MSTLRPASWTPAFNQRQFLLQLVITVSLLLILAALGRFPNTELIAAAFVFVFVWTRTGRTFLIEFVPLLALLLLHKRLRAVADTVFGINPNVQNIIQWERALPGGTLPGHFLQTHLWDQFYTPVLDVITNGLYLFHFFWLLIAAALIWKTSRTSYRAYAAGLVVLSYAALVTYAVFPATPPWLATYHGYLRQQPIRLDHFVDSAQNMVHASNPVAAMPSLHTGYPFYIALVATHVWGKKALPVFLLPLAVAFSTVYLGHHYVVDALGGVLYATLTFVLVYLGGPWWAKKRHAARDLVSD
jgi:membrane-associated phospholipid phosphatase